MAYPDDHFDLDFILIQWIDYRMIGINQSEVESAFRDTEKEWYPIIDPQTNDRFYYFIGFGSKARFLLVLLKEHESDFNRLLVHRITIASHEPQIRKLYYEPKFKKR